MPFAYYRRLSSADKAIYRRSDATESVVLSDATALHPLVLAMQETLASEDRRALQKSADELVGRLMRTLRVPPVSVRVLSVRPSSAASELHGLYVQEANKRAVITVWMRTAAHKRVVAFRTFLRTLLHEVCHHLDYQLYGLTESFHTEGFFRRESSLMRQLAPQSVSSSMSEETSAPRRRTEMAGTMSRSAGSAQLELPLHGKR